MGEFLIKVGEFCAKLGEFWTKVGEGTVRDAAGRAGVRQGGTLGRAPFQSGGADPQKNVIFVSRAFYVVKTDVFGHVKMLAENVSLKTRRNMLTFSANIFT